MRRNGGIAVSTAGSVAGPSSPPSPTMSAHTTATNVGISANRLPPYLINRADLRNSLSTYDTLLAAAKTYTQALLALGTASSELAVALESCSRLKGAHEVGGGLLAASGIHHMAGNAFSILADSFWKEASIPLLEHHDLYVQACADRTVQHERAIQAKSKALQEAEKRNAKSAKGKAGRDLHSFRQALNELQRHVDELDQEKSKYYTEVLEGEEECWTFVQTKVMGALRCQIDTHERIASKGLSDPLLEPILAGIADPFSAYGPPSSEDKIYSILSQGVLQSLSDQERSFSSDSATPANELSAPLQKPSNLILSPGTPSKGLSRVTSGAASPQLAQADGKALEGTASPPIIHGASSSVNGLGVSLTAAAELARQQGSRGSQGLSEAQAAKIPANFAGRRGELTDASAAELFGTDEDDAGDEASIFSGTEDDEGRGALPVAATTGDEGIYSSDGVNSRQPGMAARIIAEKKRRRDHAVRANAKTRLRNALSTIDESKSPVATQRVTSGRPSDRADDENTIDADCKQNKHERSTSAESRSKTGSTISVRSGNSTNNALGPRDPNIENSSDAHSHEDEHASTRKRDGSDASQATAVPSVHVQDPESHSVWH